MNSSVDRGPMANKASHAITTGNSLARQGHYREAETQYRYAIELDPLNADIHNNLANVLKEQNHFDEALSHYKKAIRYKPDNAMAHNNIGILLREQGHPKEAIEHHQQALVLSPNYSEAYYNLANAFFDLKDFEGAVTNYKHALMINNNYAEAYMNLGNALREQNQSNEAISCYKQAIIISPQYAEAYYNLGNLYLDLFQLQESIECFNNALRLRPHYKEAHLNLGNAFRSSEQYKRALQCYASAQELDPHYAEAHLNEAFTRLLLGDFKEGWLKNEWRWDMNKMRPTQLTKPPWDGRALHGKTVLIHCEQGLGDSLQFVRYVSHVKEKGGCVILLCPPPLARLFKTIKGIDALYTNWEDLPSYDYHAALLSLPTLFFTDQNTIPSFVPYIDSSPEQSSLWKERLKSYTGIKVGLVWAGNARIDQRNAYLIDRRRSMNLNQLSTLGTIPNIHFFSLQKGPPSNQITQSVFGAQLIDFMDLVSDFSDTAGLVSLLDLVIGVDTSVIHLAAAMAKPVWVLTRYDGCWRWMLDRDDSPWYPTLRLFRQKKNESWDIVINRVYSALLDWQKTVNALQDLQAAPQEPKQFF